MTIITELANGNTEVFESGNYLISRAKDFHPMILKVSIFADGKKIKTVSRRFKFFYKHFTFKSKKVQEELRKLSEQKQAEKTA